MMCPCLFMWTNEYYVCDLVVDEGVYVCTMGTSMQSARLLVVFDA